MVWYSHILKKFPQLAVMHIVKVFVTVNKVEVDVFLKLCRFFYNLMGWKKHKLESRLPGKISITSDMQMTPPLWQKVKRTKKPLDESEGEE